jgi:hypothetical protein
MRHSSFAVLIFSWLSAFTFGFRMNRVVVSNHQIKSQVGLRLNMGDSDSSITTPDVLIPDDLDY